MSPVEFVERLRSDSSQPARYAELQTPGHAFDLNFAPRCRCVIETVTAFAQSVRDGSRQE